MAKEKINKLSPDGRGSSGGFPEKVESVFTGTIICDVSMNDVGVVFDLAKVYRLKDAAHDGGVLPGRHLSRNEQAITFSKEEILQAGSIDGVYSLIRNRLDTRQQLGQLEIADGARMMLTSLMCWSLGRGHANDIFASAARRE